MYKSLYSKFRYYVEGIGQLYATVPFLLRVKVKLSRYRPGQALGASGG
jgi:hypothetical protein